MSMFCFQCQEAAGNVGCTVKGVCGKPESTANLQDVLVYSARGLGLALDMLHRAVEQESDGITDSDGLYGGVRLEEMTAESGSTMFRALFATVTNANFDDTRLAQLTGEVLRQKDAVVRHG